VTRNHLANFIINPKDLILGVPLLHFQFLSVPSHIGDILKRLVHHKLLIWFGNPWPEASRSCLPHFSQPLTSISRLCSEYMFFTISENCVVYSKNLSEEFTHQSPCCQECGSYKCNTKSV